PEQRDDRDRAPPIVAHRVQVPPGVAAARALEVEARPSITLSAASRPLSAAIGTPAPGFTLPPAKYCPGRFERYPVRKTGVVHPWDAGPYSAPPVAGNIRSKSAGVVTTGEGPALLSERPNRCS